MADSKKRSGQVPLPVLKKRLRVLTEIVTVREEVERERARKPKKGKK